MSFQPALPSLLNILTPQVFLFSSSFFRNCTVYIYSLSGFVAILMQYLTKSKII